MLNKTKIKIWLCEAPYAIVAFLGLFGAFMSGAIITSGAELLREHARTQGMIQVMNSLPVHSLSEISIKDL